jgi:hypothetical protein
MNPHMNGVEEQEAAQNVAWGPMTVPTTPIGEFLTIAAPKAKFYVRNRNLFTGAVFNCARPGGIVELLTVPVNPKNREAERLENSRVLSMAFPDDTMREAAQSTLVFAERLRGTVNRATDGGHISHNSNNDA